MRTYENLLKRINLVETAFDEVPNAILAYRMQAYLKRSYKTLALNGVKIEEV
ncbi:hypothetical protein KMC81_gp14 [Lactococcus phage 50102]|uniref:Uncharacterized protein n=1 Tax=Lactococcus phage 50102 TaxID=2024336 RepID=A0A2Z2RXR1_9CAUD|nr:hypothetical protein KMC81_gp14 [Lactococcus phage 50102]ASZ70875.1 hypothetical protein 50102_14 [Lactococcus phage 50102]